jgi:hypothetical protein
VGLLLHVGSRDSTVGILTGYGLDDRGVGVRVPIKSRIFSSSRRPDRPLGPPSLLSNGYRGLFSRRLSGGSMKLTTHLQLVSRSRKCRSIHPLPHTPSWCMRNWLSTGTTLSLLLTFRCRIVLQCVDIEMQHMEENHIK